MLFCITIVIICFSSVRSQFNDTTVRQTRLLSSSLFDEIVTDGAFDVFLSQTSNQTSTPTVEIEATIDIQNDIIVEIIDNHILWIHLNGSRTLEKNIYVYIRFRSALRRYTIKGSGNILTDDHGITNEGIETFIFDHQGVANVAIRLNVSKFDVYFTGTGNSRFWGEVREEATFDAKGVGDINALNLLTKQIKVRSMGITILRIAAKDDIQIEVTGISNVYYRLPNRKKPSKAISTGLGKIVSMP